MFVQTKYDIGDRVITNEEVTCVINVTSMDGRTIIYYFLNDEVFLETEILCKVKEDGKQI
jgi:hypothetical protein